MAELRCRWSFSDPSGAARLAAGTLHRLLRHLPGIGHLGLHRGGLSLAGALERAEPRVLIALDHERPDRRRLSVDRRPLAGAPFVFFAAMMPLQFLVVLFLYPETKACSLEQI
jgi:hypothetical protein